MRVATTLLILGLVELSCATATSAQAPPSEPTASFAVSELTGLGVPQVRERIGARATDHDYVSELRLTADGNVETRDSFDLLHGGGRCAPDSVLTLQLPGEPSRPAFPRFIF